MDVFVPYTSLDKEFVYFIIIIVFYLYFYNHIFYDEKPKENFLSKHRHQRDLYQYSLSRKYIYYKKMYLRYC